MPGPMESSCREHEDRAIDKQGKHERDTRVDGGEFDRLASAHGRLLELPRLHDGRMQVEIVRHHGCANSANTDV